MRDWRRSLLKALHVPATKQNLRFLSTWQRWEGGHTHNDATFNWLNTTMDAPGAIGSVNSVGVKKYRSFQDGVNATALTLMNGHYDDIVAGLLTGNPYKAAPSRGLQIWVSGRPDGNPEYAQKVLAGGGAPKGTLPAGGAGAKGNLALAPSQPAVNPLIEMAFADDPGFLDLMRSVGGVRPGQAAPAPRNTGHVAGLELPLKWKGTHVTDDLGWGTNTAVDIMGDPGTPLHFPVGGEVVYFHPQGAQGGGSMLIRLENGREIWMGHITSGLKAGTRFRPGDRIAVISPDHPRPHVHLDTR